MSDVSFSDHFAGIFHYSFLKAASVIYYLLTHYNPPSLIGSFYGTALSDGGPLSVTRTQFFTFEQCKILCRSKIRFFECKE